MTEVDLPVGQGSAVQTSDVTEETSCIPHVSSAENVGHFQNMRKECHIKNFDGLGPFSYVCRMIRVSGPIPMKLNMKRLISVQLILRVALEINTMYAS